MDTREELKARLKRDMDRTWWIGRVAEADDNAIIITGDGLGILRFEMDGDQAELIYASDTYFPQFRAGASYPISDIELAVREMADANSSEAVRLQFEKFRQQRFEAFMTQTAAEGVR